MSPDDGSSHLGGWCQFGGRADCRWLKDVQCNRVTRDMEFCSSMMSMFVVCFDDKWKVPLLKSMFWRYFGVLTCPMICEFSDFASPGLDQNRQRMPRSIQLNSTPSHQTP